MMRRAIFVPLFFLAAVASSCNGSFPSKGVGKRILVTLDKSRSDDPGSATARLPIKFSTGPTFTYRLEMQKPDGSLDTSFDGWVRLSARPGTVFPLQRNVKMTAGVADNVQVTIAAAFGDTRVWAEDLGYTPTPPGMTLPACSNGVDDDKNGTIDFPAEPGCFSPDDDDEGAGTLATGVSDVVYFVKPRIADVRGVTDNNGTATAFPHEQVQLDTGYHADTGKYDFNVIVTRVASDGFYVTDVEDQNTRGYASVFAFTFSAPQKLAVCDRLRSMGGTSADFFGFTEISFPTWSVEFYNPSAPARPCLVPEPRVLAIAELSNLTVLFKYESALVRLQTGGMVTARIGKHFGNKVVPKMGAAYVPGDDATSCDLNQSGKVDFADLEEAACSNACKVDPDCSEWTNFVSQSNFKIAVTDGMTTGTIQANASTSPQFDPVNKRGTTLGAFTGSLRYFSGGQQFTIEARCSDDIVDAGMQPLASDKACIRPRPELDLNEMSH